MRVPAARPLPATVLVLVLAALPMSLAGAAPAAAQEQLEVSFLDVGEADATLLDHPDGTILVDTGYQGRSDVTDYLEAAGVDSIDLLVVTHPHPDHIGQFAEIIDGFDVDTVWWSGSEPDSQAFQDAEAALARSSADYREPRVGHTREVGPLEVEVVNPPTGVDTTDVHAANLVLRITFGGSRWLFTGDAEEPTERRMVEESAELLEADVYQVGHHGSETSTSQALLDVVDPAVAVWSASEDNSYDPPSPTVLDRLDDHGVVTFGTRDHGTVTATTDGTTVTVTTATGEEHTFTVGDRIPAEELEFSDIAGNTHEDAIDAIVDAGVTRGCAEDRYCPREPVRRDQMASFLARALDLEDAPDIGFSDVADDNPHHDAIMALADAGITTGCAEDRFCPAASITREQMASFLDRAFDLPDAEVAYFHDVDEPHAAATQRLAEAGISSGCDRLGLGFCPRDTVRRDQMASFLARALDLADRTSIPLLLEPGDQGPHVEALQRRLAAHGYWVGPADGRYDLQTRHAVLAIQKAHDLTRDGIYGPVTRGVVAAPDAPATASSSGYVVEFDEDRQLLMLVQDGTAETIFHASGGNEEEYTYEDETYLATTPNGRWDVYREIDGWRTSRLGELYRPKYFHTGGYAVHGYTNVPAQAASHGCVRVSLEAMDWLWANDALPIGTDVLVYGSPS